MLKKRLAVLLGLFIIYATIYVTDVGVYPTVTVSAPAYNGRQTVIIDAGHGGLTNTIKV